jgi:HipA-like C-terminal domain
MLKDDKDRTIILGVLSQKGLVSSQELQVATGISQASVSRLLDDLSSRVLTFGKARATRYGLPKSILGYGAQQPIWWTNVEGRVQQIGTLSLLTGDTLFVESDRVLSATTGTLPWFLAPLHVQGFLGRLHAQHLEKSGISGNPEKWGLESILFSALHLHDVSGAITIGMPDAHANDSLDSPLTHVFSEHQNLGSTFDKLAANVAKTFPVGSSAGGEQPKFLAVMGPSSNEPARHVLVKFSPPRGTPYGERWHDLLHAEVIANETLAEHGVPVAKTFVVESPTRTYLVSERFDRVGANGRRHVVSVGDAHKAFVATSYSNWAATCAALARQRRLSELDAERAAALFAFGRLIGNSDMHSGNLGLFVEMDGLAKGRFTLAPVYDMLPMRWRPNPALGEAPDYTPFNVDGFAASSAAARPAHSFWLRLAESKKVSVGIAKLAGEMARRVA